MEARARKELAAGEARLAGRKAKDMRHSAMKSDGRRSSSRLDKFETLKPV